MPDGEGSAAKGRRAAVYGAAPLLSLALVQAVEQGERQSLAQAVEGLQTDFGVSDLTISALPAAMTVVGVLGAVPFGVLADRWRRVTLLGVAVAFWTVVMGVNAIAPTFALLFLARLGVGALESNSPAAISLIADWYPARLRARNLGLYQSGALAGALFGLVAGGIAVSLGGWRWAFAMWVPIGAAVAVFVLRQPEPRRGDQDADFRLDLAGAAFGEAGAVDDVDAAVGDRRDLSLAAALRTLRRIPTFWLALVALTLAQLLLTSLQFWAVEFFKRHHGLGAAQAGGLVAGFGLGSALGVVGGGFVADRLMARGWQHARPLVVAVGSIGTTLALVPAFAVESLLVAAPFQILGGFLLTVPLAPSEAIAADVVDAELRGRSGAVRAAVRSLAAVGPVVVGALSDVFDLRTAILVLTPTYAIGGLVALLAMRTYPRDLARVLDRAGRHSPDP